MSNQEWRVLDGEGNDQGPYSLQDLQHYFASGNITRETLVWTEGFAEWYPAGQVQGLLPEVPPAPVPPSAQAAAPAPPAAPPRTGAPLWLSLTTITIGIVCLILYFFPWVSLSINTNPEGKPKMMTAFTQTGMQSVTSEVNFTDDFLSKPAEMMIAIFGGDEAEVKKELEKEMKDDENNEWGMSALNLIAFIAIGLAVILVLIGLLNKLASLVIIAQSLLAVGAVLIGIQMAIQFPVIEDFVEDQKEERKKLEEEQAAEAKLAKEAEDAPTTPESARQKDKAQQSQPKQAKLFKTSFEPSCYTTVALLALSLFLVVITMSSSNNTPLITPQGNYQSPQSGNAPQQSNQPGGGLRFH